MQKLSKLYNITVKFEDLPKSILGIYINVLDTPHIVLNNILHTDTQPFIFFACLFFKDKEDVGKITITDMEKTDFMPFIYAKQKVEEYNVC